MNLVIKDGKIYQELELDVLVREYEELRISIENKKKKKLIEIENIIQRLKQIKIKIMPEALLTELLKLSVPTALLGWISYTLWKDLMQG